MDFLQLADALGNAHVLFFFDLTMQFLCFYVPVKTPEAYVFFFAGT
jgi:hypothetical protein